jgi:thiamine biosynthesis lipoprotein
MQQTRIIMGMPITVEMGSGTFSPESGEKVPDPISLSAVFDYFTYIDKTFSTYKPDSEMTRINRGELPEGQWSDDMKIIFMLAEETKRQTGGFFDIRRPPAAIEPTSDEPHKRAAIDPSGIVKGWAIWKAAQLLESRGVNNFFIDAGGDIQTRGMNSEGRPWSIGIKNPLKQNEIVKTIFASTTEGLGVATSGTYIRGKHIYNPKTGAPVDDDVASLTIVGPNIYDADRFATAAFAMGRAGINFIEQLPKTMRLEGYMIDKDGIATMTTGFEKYT